MKYGQKKINITVTCGRNVDDPEKCVLPAIMFINANHAAFSDINKLGSTAFIIAFGWWDWSVKFRFIIK